MGLISITETLLSNYVERIETHLPFIIGVDGLGGAGKTTCVKQLRKDLKDKGYDVRTLHIDDYIVESNKRYKTGCEEWYEYYFLQWNIKLLRAELFQKLRAGEELLTLPFYDRTTDTILTKEINITPASIVLIEGIFIQRREWRSYFDFVIFIDCPSEERVERVLNRDLYIGDYQKRLHKYQRRYWIAEEQYLKMENPLEKADRIYNSMKT